MKLCDCNRIFRRDISRSVFLITMAIAITSAPSPSLRSRSVTCRTKPKPIWRSARFSGVRASGLNQLRIWKKPPHSIRKTQACCLILLAITWPCAISRLPTRFLIAQSPQRLQSFAATALKGYLAAAWKGDLSVAEKQLSSVPEEVDPDGLVTLRAVLGADVAAEVSRGACRSCKNSRGETLITYHDSACAKGFPGRKHSFSQGDKAEGAGRVRAGACDFGTVCCAKRLKIPLDTRSMDLSLRH